MTRLCFLLHHKRDPQDPASHNISLADGAEGLFTLAVTTDKYGCADAVHPTGSSWVTLRVQFDLYRHIHGSGAVPHQCGVPSWRPSSICPAHQAPCDGLFENIQFTRFAPCHRSSVAPVPA